jgi:DNA-binding transcriptional LysR family regulator
MKQLLPLPGETSRERAWRGAFAELETRALDVAIIPSDAIPPRFERRCILEEDFVIAARVGHVFARDPSLQRYCAQRHCVVSESGDPYGFVDQHLAEQGQARRVALTVPNFMFALAVVAESDLICALPRRLVSLHAARFGIVGRDPPVTLPRFRLNAVTPKVAMMDAGVAWLFELLDGEATRDKRRRKRG